MGVRHYLRVFQAYQSLHLKTAMEYRLNFFTQMTFMVFNDLIWLGIWFFLFEAFPMINGYQMRDVMLIFGISALGYGIIAAFFGNRRNIWEIIIEGRFDYYLSQPIDELFHALISKSSYDGFGDILFGILVLVVFAPDAVLVGIVVSLFGAMVLLAFMILMDSSGFFLEHPKQTTRAFNSVVLSFAAWPVDVYAHAAKAIVYGVMIAFIATVPYHLVAAFSWGELLALIAVAFTALGISVLVFRYGTFKYESGNLVATRT